MTGIRHHKLSLRATSDPSAPAALLAHHTRQFQDLTTCARRLLDTAFARGRPQTMRNAARFLLDCYATYHRWLDQHEIENEATGVPYPRITKSNAPP